MSLDVRHYASAFWPAILRIKLKLLVCTFVSREVIYKVAPNLACICLQTRRRLWKSEITGAKAIIFKNLFWVRVRLKMVSVAQKLTTNTDAVSLPWRFQFPVNLYISVIINIARSQCFESSGQRCETEMFLKFVSCSKVGCSKDFLILAPAGRAWNAVYIEVLCWVFITRTSTTLFEIRNVSIFLC